MPDRRCVAAQRRGSIPVVWVPGSSNHTMLLISRLVLLVCRSTGILACGASPRPRALYSTSVSIRGLEAQQKGGTVAHPWKVRRSFISVLRRERMTQGPDSRDPCCFRNNSGAWAAHYA